MPRHRRPAGRHRPPPPPPAVTPAILVSAALGATVAAMSTAASSGGGLTALAAAVTSTHVPTSVVATDGAYPRSGARGVPAEVPLSGRAALATTAAGERVRATQATRAARARQLALIEAARPKWVLPMPRGSYRITSPFGPRWGALHGGLDMAAPAGTPVYAAGDGTVLEPAGTSGFGNVVVIEHGTGEVTLYGHNSTVLVRPGERVRAGQLVALVGSSGISTGNHLHFEVREAGIQSDAIDTTTWLARHGVTV